MRLSHASTFLAFVVGLLVCGPAAEAAALKLHRIFSSNMVLQRDKPIMIWGWADPGQNVTVKFGDQQADATAQPEQGRWQVQFPAQEANATSQKLIVTAGEKTLELDNTSLATSGS